MGNCLKPRRAASWADGDEWEEAKAEFHKAAAAAAQERAEAERVEVKVRVTRRQLQELLEKASGKAGGRQVEEVLAELLTAGTVCYRQQRAEMRAQAQWRPSLYSIPEAAEES